MDRLSSFALATFRLNVWQLLAAALKTLIEGGLGVTLNSWIII